MNQKGKLQNECQEQFFNELKKMPKGKSALIGAGRGLVKKGYSQKYLSSRLQINRRTLSVKQKLNKKIRINVKNIKEFYTRSDISRVTPQRRFATKDGPGYLLLFSVKEVPVHAKYLNENKQETVSSSTFAALRPKYVRLLTSSHREYCMCGYCMNVRNKLLTLEHTKKTSPKAVNEYDILEMILCPKPSSQRFFSIDCIEGRCKKCSNYLET